MRKRLLFFAKIAVTLVLLTVLLRAADWHEVLLRARDLNVPLLAGAVLLFLPQTLVSAWRWKLLVRPVTRIGYAESLREILAASALNLVVPAKLGDFSKAAMLPDVPYGKRKEAGLRAVAEKFSDVVMLLMAIGLGALTARSLAAGFVAAAAVCAACLVVHVELVRRRGAAVFLPFVATTGLLWVFHFAQMHLFLHCCGVPSTWSQTLERVPPAIFAGLIPAAFCGIGTRDAALVYLYSDIADPSRTAVVGMLTALRYLVPGAIGIPILWTRRQTSRRPRSPDAPETGPEAERAVANRRPLRPPVGSSVRR